MKSGTHSSTTAPLAKFAARARRVCEYGKRHKPKHGLWTRRRATP